MEKSEPFIQLNGEVISWQVKDENRINQEVRQGRSKLQL